MGLFNKLFGSQKPNSKALDKDLVELRTLVESSPRLSDFVDYDELFPNSQARFTDDFKTSESFKLREILALIWWGKVKKGRALDAASPKYFFYDYKLNVKSLTKQFISSGLLSVSEKEIVTLTEEGKNLADKYAALWEIHSYKGYPTNLDRDFPDWDETNFTVKNNSQMIKYYEGRIAFFKADIEYSKHYQDINKHASSNSAGVDNDLNEIKSLEEEIKRLKDFNLSLMN